MVFQNVVLYLLHQTKIIKTKNKTQCTHTSISVTSKSSSLSANKETSNQPTYLTSTVKQLVQLILQRTKNLSCAMLLMTIAHVTNALTNMYYVQFIIDGKLFNQYRFPTRWKAMQKLLYHAYQMRITIREDKLYACDNLNQPTQEIKIIYSETKPV